MRNLGIFTLICFLIGCIIAMIKGDMASASDFLILAGIDLVLLNQEEELKRLKK